MGSEQRLVAVWPDRADLHDLHLVAPVIRRGDGAMVGAEADQGRLLAEGGAAELADVELALPAHLGGGGIADMAVMCPDHRLGIWPAALQQGAERVEHVPVAQVPAFG